MTVIRHVNPDHPIPLPGPEDDLCPVVGRFDRVLNEAEKYLMDVASRQPQEGEIRRNIFLQDQRTSPERSRDQFADVADRVEQSEGLRRLGLDAIELSRADLRLFGERLD